MAQVVTDGSVKRTTYFSSSITPPEHNISTTLLCHAAFIGRRNQGGDGADAAAMAAGRCGGIWFWMAAPRSGHGCGPAAPAWRECELAEIPAQDEPCRGDLAALEEAL